MRNFIEIFYHFLYLGLISFGGPAAHLGYFYRYFIEKKQWLNGQHYSQIIALSQFLPGPSSSQVAFAIGYQRFGLLGAIAAFLGFTLPAFFLMYVIALSGNYFQESTSFIGITLGLKLFAVVIVADAVLSMAKVFCQSMLTRAIALLSTFILIIYPSVYMQLGVLLVAALIALLMKKNVFSNVDNKADAILGIRGKNDTQSTVKKNNINKPALILFTLLFFALPFLAEQNTWLALFADFYQSGSLVFGGGHVVLPLLQQSLSGELTHDSFLLGYSAAQAMPGPMFTMATYLGAVLTPQGPFLGALLATLAIFLPGFLLVLSFYHAWQKLAHHDKLSRMIIGINAAVVGLLCAALYQPIALSALHAWFDLAYVLLGLILLRFLKLPVLALLIAFAGLGLLQVQL